MRIMKGLFKGRNITCPKGIRPVSFRVKKSCFDIISDRVENACVLDLFAGSGILGIEAISSGAKRSVFVDLNWDCLDAVRNNLIELRLGNQSKVFHKDSYRAIKEFSNKRVLFDIIFVDPPYYKGMVKKSLQTLEEYDIVSASGLVVCFCYAKDEFVRESSKLPLILEKKFGQTLLLIYQQVQ